MAYTYWHDGYWDIQPCPRCHGSGYINGEKCETCVNGTVGMNMTCHCVMMGKPKTGCFLCSGTGIKGWTGITPPAISNQPISKKADVIQKELKGILTIGRWEVKYSTMNDKIWYIGPYNVEYAPISNKIQYIGPYSVKYTTMGDKICYVGDWLVKYSTSGDRIWSIGPHDVKYSIYTDYC